MVLGLAALPLCAGALLALWDVVIPVWRHALLDKPITPSAVGFIAGCGLYVMMDVAIWRPSLWYVRQHEWTHALAAWSTLARVENLKATATGGHVVTSRSNTWIRLAPYLLPLFPAMLLGVYAAIITWRPIIAPDMYALAVALGVLYAFHMIFTIRTLADAPDDLAADGFLFSAVLIFLVNLAIFAALTGFLTGGVPGAKQLVVNGAVETWSHTLEIIHNAAAGADRLFQDLRRQVWR